MTELVWGFSPDSQGYSQTSEYMLYLFEVHEYCQGFNLGFHIQTTFFQPISQIPEDPARDQPSLEVLEGGNAYHSNDVMRVVAVRVSTCNANEFAEMLMPERNEIDVPQRL